MTSRRLSSDQRGRGDAPCPTARISKTASPWATRYNLQDVQLVGSIGVGGVGREYSDQFEQWWNTLTEDEQDHIAASVQLLSDHGPSLGRPAVDSISSSRHPNMKELRAGTPRTLFAFDPRRTAILLLGGDKSGEWNRWYETAVPAADDLYDEHLATIDSKGPT